MGLGFRGWGFRAESEASGFRVKGLGSRVCWCWDLRTTTPRSNSSHCNAGTCVVGKSPEKSLITKGWLAF